MGILGSTEIYREPLHRKYYASRASCAYLFFLGTVVVMILAPFFLAYTSGNFWLKENVYREQPRVLYKYKLIHVLEGTDTSGVPMEIFYSTITRANEYHPTTLRVPLIRSSEIDENGDGIPDRLEINIKTPIIPGETIYSSSTLLFFDYQLRDRARIKMETLGYVHFASGLGGRALLFDGDLTLRQTWPFQVTGGYKHLYSSGPSAFFDTDPLQARDLVPSTLLQRYRSRNITTHAQGEYVWSRAGPQAEDAGVSMPNFNLTATIRYPVTAVAYTPDVPEVLKDAWIKYLAMLVIVGYLLDRLCSFVYYHQIVETRMRVEVPASKDGLKHHNL